MALYKLNFQHIKTFMNFKYCCKKLNFCNLLIINQQCYSYSSVQFKAPNIFQTCDNIDKNQASSVIAKVNEEIVKNTHGRLFAVVHVMGHQYKVTTEDLLVIRGTWPPNISNQIRLEKVLLVGSSNFTLIGTPLLPLDQVSVIATVIEKTLTHAYPLFYFRPRKNFQKLNFFKDELTYLRINSIKLLGEVNKLGDTDGFKNKIF